jgi:N-acetylneuraminic acid mutarotase
VTVTSAGFTSATVAVSFVVAPEAPSSDYGVVVSSSADRSAPIALDGQTVAGNVFVFTSPDSGVSQVRFYVDDPGAVGAPFRTENLAPYDLSGGSLAAARPFDTTTLPDGEHSITAAIDKSGGGTDLVTATFIVSNNTPAPNDGWSTALAMPVALGEVASGLIDGKIYVVGEGSSVTQAYDLATESWNTGLAVRPFVGHHHAAEVIGGKLYLFGGLHGGSDGKVQIYDPTSDTWSLGADMPFAAGSSSAAVIGNFVYVVGGIVGSSTTSQAARYDPATNTWSAIAPMPAGRNHAAAESDGEKLYVFGGRGAGSGDGNTVANGFDTVQVYDPTSDTWATSLDPGSGLAPLPQARGGTGVSVYLGGEFYVIGGETADGAGATALGVYDRVDIYDPGTNQWRAGPPMPTPRHGIFPVVEGTEIHVIGGGTKSGNSASTVHEVLRTDEPPALT